MKYIFAILAALAVGACAQDWDYYSDCHRCLYESCDWSGSCEYGCKPGWMNSDCGRPCIGSCEENKCDQWTGYCLYGCANNTQGIFCDEPCEIGCSDGMGGCRYMDSDEWCDWWEQCPICEKCEGYECITDGSTATAALTPALLGLTALLTKYLMA